MSQSTLQNNYSFIDDPDVPVFDHSYHLLIMDGECALCSRGARIISAMDRKNQFRIAPVKSPLGIALLTHYGFDPEDPDSWLYVANGRAYSSMDAIIRVARACGGIGHLAILLTVLPKSIQDWLYQRIARNRYRLFGRTDMCALPDKRLQDRLIK